ncbi:hypothetical protein NIES2104_52050 [Leptolyngbya sp. NIES-2104]|nr:hypothetical protein NIES2104_52050 [Leptolyngbya sp. NIES-2104]
MNGFRFFGCAKLSRKAVDWRMQFIRLKLSDRAKNYHCWQLENV